jgi:hypothetical protein
VLCLSGWIALLCFRVARCPVHLSPFFSLLDQVLCFVEHPKSTSDICLLVWKRYCVFVICFCSPCSFFFSPPLPSSSSFLLLFFPFYPRSVLTVQSRMDLRTGTLLPNVRPAGGCISDVCAFSRLQRALLKRKQCSSKHPVLARWDMCVCLLCCVVSTRVCVLVTRVIFFCTCAYLRVSISVCVCVCVCV